MAVPDLLSFDLNKYLKVALVYPGAEVLLDAEAKLGEMLAVIPDYHSSGKGTMKRKELPSGITKKESHFALEIVKRCSGFPVHLASYGRTLPLAANFKYRLYFVIRGHPADSLK